MKKQNNSFSRFPLGVYILLFVTVAAFFILTKGTVGPKHLLNVIRQAAPLGLVSIGQTLILLMGGIDLSVGAVISMVNIVASAVMGGNAQNIPLACALSLGLALLVGLLNGIIVVRFNMPAFLVTMAMSSIIQGSFFIYTKGSPKGSIAREFRFISDGWIGDILPVALVIWIAIWVFMSLSLHKTPYGKRYYFTGANPLAAGLSGVHTGWITVSAYMLCSLMAGLAGLVISAFIGVASSGVGNPYTTNSIAASVVGGASFSGGIGTLEGTFPGVLIMSFLQSILTMLNVPEAGKNISQGLVIAVMVGLNVRKARN
ncbi:sugar ABC transporter permease [Spirochaetia bacterium]|nr:sugar ABC transporter permease [Spirochaetia bacterium]